MPKYYIDFHKKRDFYAIEGNKTSIHVNLKDKEVIVILRNILNAELLNVTGNNTSLKLSFSNDIVVTIAKKAFGPKNDKYDEFFKIVQKKLKEFKNREEKKNLKNYSKKLGGYTPSINRRKSAKLGTLLVTGVSIGVLINSYLEGNSIMDNNKEEQPPIFYEDVVLIDKNPTNTLSSEEKLPTTENYLEIMSQSNIHEVDTTKTSAEDEQIYSESNLTNSSTTNLESNSQVDYKTGDETNTYSIDIPFESRANDGKVAGTIEYCGYIIEYYANRYGLPYELVCAQMTQERPDIINGKCDNICQVIYSYFVGEEVRVPIYDENGLTGEYDEIKITKELLDSKEGNIQVGLAYLRYCIDKHNSLTTGLFSYNQGDNSLRNACKYFGLDYQSYLGEEKAMDACELIVNYYRETKDYTYGDPNYLAHVFSYLELDERGSKTITCFVNEKEVSVAINNTLAYNNELSR